MGMDAGDETVVVGTMARDIYDAVNAEFGTVTGQEDTDRKRGCATIAIGVVTHLTANADVRVTASDSGLQRDNTGGNPDTLAPSTDVVLSGSLE